MGTQLPLPKGAQPLQFLADVYCAQTAGWIKMALGVEVDLGPGDIAIDGNPAPPNWHSPQFSAYIRCSQTARWIKMPLDMEVGLGQATLC